MNFTTFAGFMSWSAIYTRFLRGLRIICTTRFQGRDGKIDDTELYCRIHELECIIIYTRFLRGLRIMQDQVSGS